MWQHSRLSRLECSHAKEGHGLQLPSLELMELNLWHQSGAERTTKVGSSWKGFSRLEISCATFW